ncbi:hypothetical protein DRO02_00360 [archaeon]|nr:MAG: hypothetical protein DRO21_01670 [archaeon]RLG66056.1 MAG: hypothetical protein DRN89_01665 [archaeon]RLG66128.1 MAG: hypothetical protein DRO02_00360 [archaeon]HDM23608.1 ferrous iron transport protein A [Candidatus Bathyarchaeota archaeon]
MPNLRSLEIKEFIMLPGTKLDLKLLNRLTSMGLVPGRRISVISKGKSGILLEVDNSMIFVSREMLRLLFCQVDDRER